jgi:DNA-binding transcriptional LysR family regulator
VRVTLDERVSPDIVRSVREGLADLGVLWNISDLSGLVAVPYRVDHLCVAMSSQHRLARRPSLSFVDTLGEMTIGVAAGGSVDTVLRREAALLGKVPDYRVQVSSMDAAFRIVAAGLGLAILPREAAAPHAAAGRLSLVPLTDAWATRQFVVVSRPPALMPASARLLAEHLRDRAR